MHPNRLLPWLLTAVIALAASPPAFAGGDPDPEEIAQHCIEVVIAKATRCVARNEIVAAHCVPIIEELVESGQIELAHFVAAFCIHHINVSSHHCVHHIYAICSHCIHILLALGAPELAEIVAHVCEEAIGAVVESRNAAVEAILDALLG